MSKRLIVSNLLIVVIGLLSLPISQAQISAQSSSLKISKYRDDPYVAEPEIDRLDASRFSQDDNGNTVLSGDKVYLGEETFIYRKDAAGVYKKFAWNPWPQYTPSNENGNFKFSDEVRFPLHEIERDANGQPVLVDGCQVWKPRNLHLGNTTTFVASHAARDAAEFWAGRDIVWGENNGVLTIEPHSFIEFNAFYSPITRSVHCAVVPYRLPGETQIKMFETATSWEMVAHESGHALRHVLKPQRDREDLGFGAWEESFADQTAMWGSLRDPRRARSLLAETSGNLLTPNSLTSFVEAFAALVGRGTGVREAFNNLKISDTSTEVHDRSEVLTGAAYKVFTLIYDGLKNGQGHGEQASLADAGEIMGIFLMHTHDYTPESNVSLEDVGKAYLKVDKEHYAGQFRNILASEFTAREIFDSTSVAEWMAHEAALPDLQIPRDASDRKVDKVIQANLDKLGIGPDFGLKMQSVARERRFGKTTVRVQLTDGRGDSAPLLDNHGILTFRANGTLADYHSPLPADQTSQITVQSNMEGPALVNEARKFGLDRRGGLLSIVRRPNGGLAVEVRVMRSEGIYCWLEVFSLDHPEGERREVIIPTIPWNLTGLQPNGVQILTANDLRE
jgi:hypothetical protein